MYYHTIEPPPSESVLELRQLSQSVSNLKLEQSSIKDELVRLKNRLAKCTGADKTGKEQKNGIQEDIQVNEQANEHEDEESFNSPSQGQKSLDQIENKPADEIMVDSDIELQSDTGSENESMQHQPSTPVSIRSHQRSLLASSESSSASLFSTVSTPSPVAVKRLWSPVDPLKSCVTIDKFDFEDLIMEFSNA